MVLVKVVAVMGKHDVGREVLFQPLKIDFYVHADVREETGRELLDDDTLRFRLLEKRGRAFAGFLGPSFV